MKKGLEFFYLPQPAGIKYVKSLSEEYDNLANYITGEIQLRQKNCEKELKIISDIENDMLEEYDSEGAGNACGSIINKERVGIYMYYDKDNPVYYPFSVFKKAIEEWYDFLNTGRERIVEFE